MTDIDQRLTLAELAGYRWLHVTRLDGTTFVQLVPASDVNQCLRVVAHGGKLLDARPADTEREHLDAPDYLGSLDAIMPLVRTAIQDDDDRAAYAVRLQLIVAGHDHIVTTEEEDHAMLTAQPRQIAAALLRALGLWTDS